MLCQMHTINSKSRGKPWPETGATHYNAQLGLTDKGRPIKGLVVYCVLRLGSMKGIGFRSCARCAGLVPCCGQDGYRAQLP